MDKTRECIDCGRALVDYVRGRPATLCGECKRGRRRVKERDLVTCIECQTVFQPPGHTGLPPKRCEPCRAARKRVTDAAKTARWRAADPERQRTYDREYQARRRLDPAYRQRRNEFEIVRKYGITMAKFGDLLAEQGGVCAICKGARNGPGVRFHVDHCHDTGKVRGLLCGKCNTAIGLFGDDPDQLRAAASYLEASRKEIP